MDQSLISVIVPVYNVKPYLARCLDSLQETHTNFELLLVNDGSKDGSAFILEEYAKKDSRIRVIHQENMGYLLLGIVRLMKQKALISPLLIRMIL